MIGKPNKLEKLVYYKLKSMKLLDKAHTNYARLAGNLEQKYEDKLTENYINLAFGESPLNFSFKLLALIQHEDYQKELKLLVENLKQKDFTGFTGIIIRLKSDKPQQGKQVF